MTTAEAESLSPPVVIFLCDFTGNMALPWAEAGCDVVLIDPQHIFSRTEGALTYLAMTVEEALPELAVILVTRRVALVGAFPPCTDLARSGARWWAEKYLQDRMFQAKAVAVAEQCRTLCQVSGSPWFVENPSGALSSVFGKPNHTFHPWWFTAYEPADNYTKLTCLWTGGGFRMPSRDVDLSLGSPDDRIHAAPPRPDRANVRSATPIGFARAVFAVNAQSTI